MSTDPIPFDKLTRGMVGNIYAPHKDEMWERDYVLVQKRKRGEKQEEVVTVETIELAAGNPKIPYGRATDIPASWFRPKAAEVKAEVKAHADLKAEAPKHEHAKAPETHRVPEHPRSGLKAT